MTFHRKTVPTYPGGLPAGYDYLNNPALNGDPGAPAPAAGKVAAGPNQGSYLTGFTDAATSSNSNRGPNALADNTDALDDLLRGALPVIRHTDVSAPGSPLASMVLSVNNVYVGSASDSPVTTNNQETRDRFFRVVSLTDDEITVGGGVVTVTLVHDGSNNNYIGNVAGGFVSNPTLNFSPSIPTGLPFRIYYGVRRNFAEIVTTKSGEYIYEQIKHLVRIPGLLQQLFIDLHDASGGAAFDDSWATTIDDLLNGGLERVVDNAVAKPVTSPDADRYPLNTQSPGAGAFMRRLGRALSLYSADAAMYVDPSQALARLVMTDVVQSRGTTGLLVEGSYREGTPTSYPGETDRQPGYASMLIADARRSHSGIHATNPLTRIIAGSAVTMTSPAVGTIVGESVVEIPAGQYFRKVSGATDIALGYDVLRLRFTQAAVLCLRDYVIVGFGSSADSSSLVKVRVRALDGSVPNFTGVSGATVVEWLRWSFGRADGAGQRWVDQNGAGISPFSSADGLTYIAPGESLEGMFVDPPPDHGFRVGVRGTTVLGGAEVFTIASFGMFVNGVFQNTVRIYSGDAVQRPSVLFSNNTKLVGPVSVGSPLGTYAMQAVQSTLTSASAIITLDLNVSRFFTLLCDATVINGQVLSIAFSTITNPEDAQNGMQVTIFFRQQISGGNVGSAQISTWPAEAIFSTPSDKQPAVGQGSVTIWEGTYVAATSGWYFTKRVY